MNGDASIGFPWNKVNAARSYLLALKPWLGPIALKMTVVPVDRPAIGGEGWLVAPQSDEKGRIYLDRSFCNSFPLHVLSGALEHEYAKVSRGVFDRLDWVDVDDWDEIAVPAFQLEIMDSMEREKLMMTPLKIEKRLSKSTQFSLYDFEDWDVQGPPSLTEAGAATTGLLKLPDGLSAETYAQLLLQARQSSPEELPEPQEDDAGDPSDAQESSGDPESMSGDSESEDFATDSGGSHGEDAQGSGTQDDSPDGVPSDDESAGAEQEEESTAADDAEGAAEPEDESSGDGEESGDPGGEGGDGSQDDGGEESEDWDADFDQMIDEELPEPQDRAKSTTQEILDEVGGPEVVERARRELMSTPEGVSWSKSIPHHDDDFAADVAPPREFNAPEVSALDMEESIDESARLTLRASMIPGSGIDIRHIEAAHRRLRSRGLSWDRHLSKVISSCLVSERIKGASDLTYSVPNPNQEEVGPRLMGMTDYAPKVTIIQDVSGSMTATMGLAMDAVAELMTAITGRLQSRSTWVTMANGIVNVGDASLLTKDVREQWSWGGGGTQLGEVIASLMGNGKKTEWKGKRLEVPDLLVVSTDAIFKWPSKRPSRAHKLVVVVYSEDHLNFLPEWVNRDTEVVVAAD